MFQVSKGSVLLSNLHVLQTLIYSNATKHEHLYGSAFISFCHTYSKQLDTQMAFSLGSKIAVSSRNQVDESQWKLSIFRDAGVRKKTEIYLEG